MQKFILLALTFIYFASCKKGSVMTVSEPFSEASYTVTFTGKWSGPAFGVPAGVHFTSLAGMVHNSDAVVWNENGYATWSLQYVAENGFATPLLNEMDTLIQQKKGLAVLNINAPPSAGIKNFALTANSNYALISFATMLAPSPDWFTGVTALPLYYKGQWVKDTFQLYAYDAGTKNGDAFSYSFPATAPQQTIKRLTPLTESVLAAGNSNLQPIAELGLVKQ